MPSINNEAMVCNIYLNTAKGDEEEENHENMMKEILHEMTENLCNLYF